MSDLPGESTGVSDLFSQDLDVAHHDIYDRHEFGKAFPIPGFPGAVLASGTPKTGSSMAPARADHQHIISAAAIRPNTLFISPTLAPGDVSGVPQTGTLTRITASLVTVPSISTYNRYVMIHAGALWIPNPPTVATPNTGGVLLDVEVEGTPVAGSSSMTPHLPESRVGYTKTTAGGIGFVSTHWSDIVMQPAGYAGAYYLNLGMYGGMDISASSCKFVLLVVGTSPVG